MNLCGPSSAAGTHKTRADDKFQEKLGQELTSYVRGIADAIRY
jgi:nickel-dependent lactate racemase